MILEYIKGDQLKPQSEKHKTKPETSFQPAQENAVAEPVGTSHLAMLLMTICIH